MQFDFPDENGKPYKSSGGALAWNEKLKRNVPASWETTVVDDVAEVFNGATPSTTDEQNYGGDVIWITPKDLSDQKQKFVYQGERNISKTGYDSCSTHLLPINTVLMSSRAPIGLLAITKAELCTNQGFKSFVPKEGRIATFLYYYLQFHIKQIEQLGTGTTFKEVSREDVLKFPILKPSDTILDLWEERVSALNERQLEIQKENETLTKQRDELLPLLMNGQVSLNSDLSVLKPLTSILPKPVYIFLMLRFIGVKELNIVSLLSPFLIGSGKLTEQHILLLDGVQPGIVMGYNTGEEDGGQPDTEHDNLEPSTDIWRGKERPQVIVRHTKEQVAGHIFPE